MSQNTLGTAAGPSNSDFKTISSCGACAACKQVGVVVIQVKSRLDTHVKQYKSLGTAYFTSVGATKSTWFDDDTNDTIADAFHGLPILEVMSSDSELDFITALCMLRSAWNKYRDVHNLTEDATGGCRATELVWESTIDDFTRATEELTKMVKRCDDSFIALEAAVGQVTDVAKRTVPGSAPPVVDPVIYRHYVSWKALVESLED